MARTAIGVALCIALLLSPVSPAPVRAAASPRQSQTAAALNGSLGTQLATRLVAAASEDEAESVIRELATAVGLRLLSEDGSVSEAAAPALLWQAPDFFPGFWARSFVRGEAWTLSEVARMAAGTGVTIGGRPLAPEDLLALLHAGANAPAGALDAPDAVLVDFLRELIRRSPGGHDLADPALDPAEVPVPLLGVNLIAASFVGRGDAAAHVRVSGLARLAAAGPCDGLGDSLLGRIAGRVIGAAVRGLFGWAASAIGLPLGGITGDLLAAANELLMQTGYQISLAGAPASAHYGHGQPANVTLTAAVSIGTHWPDWAQQCANWLGINLAASGPQADVPVRWEVLAGRQHIQSLPQTTTTGQGGTVSGDIAIRSECAPGQGDPDTGSVTIQAVVEPRLTLSGAGAVRQGRTLISPPKATATFPVEWHGQPMEVNIDFDFNPPYGALGTDLLRLGLKGDFISLNGVKGPFVGDLAGSLDLTAAGSPLVQAGAAAGDVLGDIFGVDAGLGDKLNDMNDLAEQANRVVSGQFVLDAINPPPGGDLFAHLQNQVVQIDGIPDSLGRVVGDTFELLGAGGEGPAFDPFEGDTASAPIKPIVGCNP